MAVWPATAAALDQTAPLSADGRFRAYTTPEGIALEDRTAGHTERVSVDSDGRWRVATEPDMDWSGRYVAFATFDPLAVDDTNGHEDVYIRDRACPASDGITLAGTSGSTLPALSGDGRYVAFVSSAPNLAPGDRNGAPDVFVADRNTGVVSLISVDSQERQPAGRGVGRMAPAISADGRYVAFATFERLAPADTDAGLDVYRRDLVAGTTERVSIDTEGRSGEDARNPSISADGQVVAFDWLPPGHELSGSVRKAWVRDMKAKVSETVTEWPVSSFGRGSNPSISADGTLVAFSGNELWHDEGQNRDIDSIYLYDRVSHGIWGSYRAGDPVRQERSSDLAAGGRYVSWTNAASTGGVEDFGAGLRRPVPAVATYDAPCRRPVRSAYRDTVLDDEPASYWRFGEAAGASGANDEMPPFGDLWIEGRTGVAGALAGDPNGALSLAGGQSLWAGYGRYDFPGTKPFTLEAWIRPRSLNADTRRVFSSEDAAGGLLVGVRADGIVFSRHAGGRWSTLKAPIATGRWTHVAAVYDSAGVMRLYVDGVRAAMRPSALALPSAGREFRIGSLRGRWRFFVGELDEVAVYAHGLDARQVAAHHDAGR